MRSLLLITAAAAALAAVASAARAQTYAAPDPETGRIVPFDALTNRPQPPAPGFELRPTYDGQGTVIIPQDSRRPTLTCRPTYDRRGVTCQ